MNPTDRGDGMPVVRIFVLGGNTTCGSEEHTRSGHLSRILNERPAATGVGP
jgi:hypothetical protein